MDRIYPYSQRNVTFIKRIEVDGDYVKLSRFDDAASMVYTIEFHLLFPFKTREHFVLKQDWRESRIKTGFFPGRDGSPLTRKRITACGT